MNHCYQHIYFSSIQIWYFINLIELIKVISSLPHILNRRTPLLLHLCVFHIDL